MITADLGDVLGSPAWTAAATILAAIAIGVTIWLYRRQRSRKTLSYSVKVTQLVSVHSAAKDRIEISYGNERIKQMHLVEARIENTGNVPVESSDFEQPITFDLGQGARALTAEASELQPPELEIQVQLNGQQIQLMPLLLNPGDGLTIKSFVRDLSPSSQVKCRYRIVGVSKMVDARAQREAQLTWIKRIFSSTEKFAVLVSVGALAAAAAGLTNLFESEKQTETQVQLAGGKELCGKILRTSDTKMVLQLSESGELRTLPLERIKRVNDDSC